MRQHAHEGVIVERVPDLELDAPARLAKRGQPIAGDLEAHHLSLHRRVGRIARLVA